MFELLRSYKSYDPAAQSRLEILLCYPGIKAILFHRVANALWRIKIPILPRLLSELNRFLTGIEIHPGATIGKNVVFDHGMGTVIGETAIVEDNVIIYQAVTLGGTNLLRVKRHPTIKKRVVLGAGAKILGNITVGENSRVGANSVVVRDVPANCTAVGIPARTVCEGVKEGEELSHEMIVKMGSADV